ncbi:c-type cytochrome biogenesis protein CcsB [Microlunatus sp. Y2014]|uniref:c-type cytochrome biogenesis protein CcsB n=1 Tax=Microlunatus sp. Y2014 TaxID=3418488 RepID=UPI003DA7A5C7
MSDWANLSDLAILTALVFYLLSLVAHAIEWGVARNVTAIPVAKRAPRRTKALATAGAGPAIESDASEADDTDHVDTTDSEASGLADGDDAGPTGAEVDAARTRRIEMFGRLGVNLMVLAVLFNVAGLVFRGIAGQRAPWGNMYEFTLSAVALIGLAYLVMAFKFTMRWLGLPTALVTTLGTGLAVTVFYVDVAPLVPALDSVWFVVHIAAAAVAGAAFNVGALASILYLIRSRMERKETVRGYWAKMPHSDRLDAIAYRLHAFAFPLWTFAVAAGAVWAQYAWGRFWGWDPKETWSLVMWVIYACYLHARATAGWRGKRAAVIALIGVASFWFNFIGVNMLFSGLHSYAGI